MLATSSLSAVSVLSAADLAPAFKLQFRVLVSAGDSKILQEDFRQGKFNQAVTARVPLRDRRKPPFSLAPDYSAGIAFTGCTADSTGTCRLETIFTVVNPNGFAQVAQGWLQLWHGPPPPSGRWTLGDDSFHGLFGYPAPTGKYQILAIVRDQVSGHLMVQTAPFIAEAVQSEHEPTISFARPDVASTILEIRAVVFTEEPHVMETRFLQGQLDLAAPAPTVSGTYHARVALSGCRADNTGHCRTDVVFIPISPGNPISPATGWLRLWHGVPPRDGTWTLSEGTFNGAADDPPGPHELIVVVRDQVSGSLIAQVVSFPVEAALLPIISSDQTLCDSTQAIVFSCSSGKRVISLCASPDLLRRTGHLTYRFGVLGRAPELEYPAASTKPQDAFQFVMEDYTKASTEQLQFSIGDFKYTVFAERAAFDTNESGVEITRGGRRIGAHICDSPNPDLSFMWRLRHLGLPATSVEETPPGRE